MRFGINLRGDLAKLDDTEIATRYERLIAEKVAAHQAQPSLPIIGANWLYRIGQAMLGRGPLHAPLFYRIQGVLLGFYTRDPLIYFAYRSECELKDVRDEIRRRLRHRTKTRPAAIAP